MRTKGPKKDGAGIVLLAAAFVLSAAAGVAAQTRVQVLTPGQPQKKVQAKAQNKVRAKVRKTIRRLNLNTAAETQLAALKPIGPERARKIMGLRPFRSLDELAKAGMPKPDIDAARPFLTLGGRNGKWRHAAHRLAPGEKVDLNKAALKVLMALPGIGRGRAEAIIARRPFARIEDLMKVKGIKQKGFNRVRGLIVVK